MDDFNTHRNKIKRKEQNINDDEFCFFSDNNLELNGKNKNEQINLSNNYKKELNQYNDELIQNDNEINNKINPNNNVDLYKKEINSIRQQIVLLKSKISENELIINDYKNTINNLNEKHATEIKEANNQINILKNYIIRIYQFFNDITKNYLPKLNFNFDSNRNNFKLININEFQDKLTMIDKYIFSLNDKEKNFQNIEILNYNKVKNFQNNEKINAEEEKIRMEKEDKRNFIINNFNNDFIIQKLKQDNQNIYNNDYNNPNDENNNLGVIQLYKNLENKFDILEKAIEEEKRNRYDIMDENYEDNNLNDNNNNDIILTNLSNKMEKEKNDFLEGLYRNELIMQNKKGTKNNKKKKKPLTKISQNNNLKNKKGNNKLCAFTEGNKNRNNSRKHSKNNLKNKK